MSSPLKPMEDHGSVAVPAVNGVSSSGNNGELTKALRGEKDGDEAHGGVQLTDALAEFPDGGFRAWFVVCGTTCTAFSTFGFVNAWGVFQAYYETHMLKDTSTSAIAWIGSMQYALVFFPAVLVGRLFDLGWFKLPFAIGSIGLVLSTFLIAQCTKYWQFVLVQGLLVGISSGICFGPTVGVVGHWFQRRRGLALAISACGSSIGGTVIPIVARQLIPRVGFPWTMRIIGFILTCTLGFANFASRRRLPPKNISGGVFNPKAFRDPAFSIYCFSAVVAFLGLYTVLTFIDVSAVAIGVPENFSFYLVSIANAGSGLGRLTTGLVVDKTGPVNIMVPMSVLCAVATYVWPLIRSKEGLIALAAIYGFTTATYVTSFQIPLYELGDIEDVGRRAGMVMTFAAMGAIAGPPISGTINRASGGFGAVGYYAGSMILLSCLFMLTTRHLTLKKLLGKF